MATERDPVCGMKVDSTDAAGQSNFDGQTFYFCSEHCKVQFDENPQRFASERGSSASGGV
jgi:YHS domain-containing protein